MDFKGSPFSDPGQEETGMEELDIYNRMNAIAETPQFSTFFGEESEQSRRITEHKAWLHTIRRERPATTERFRIGVYIRYFNQTKYENYLSYVKPLLPYEVFMANVEAGSDDQLMIQTLVESYGLTISNKKGPGLICAVSTLESIFTKYGYHVLDRVLRLCIGAWEGDVNSFAGNILNAIAKLVVTYGDNLIDEVFKDKIGALSIKQLTRNAKDRRPGSMGFAEVMVLEYNGKKKANSSLRLPLNKLYRKENALFKDLEEDEDEIASDDRDSLMLDGFDDEVDDE